MDLLNTEALDGIFQEMTRKLCNMHIQEVISWTKQIIAASKGFANAVK